MTHLLVVMLGGAIGSGLRHLTSLACGRVVQAFPLGTLVVNVVGCFAIGLLAHAFAGATGSRETWRIALIVGVLGGFTTFSSFGFDTFKLANDGALAKAAMNIFANNALGIAAVVIGYRLAEKMWPAV